MNVRIVAVALIAVLAPRPALACAPFIFVPHQIHPGERATDRRRPRPPAAQLYAIRRAEPELTITGGVMTVNTCGGQAYAIVRLASKDLDDRTPAAEMGFAWKLVGGRHIPQGLAIQPDPQRPPLNDIAILWTEPDGSREIAFDIVVMAVDRAGNMSKQSRVIRVRHNGT